MPRPRRKNTIQKGDILINSTTLDLDSKIMDSNHVKLAMWEAEVKDRMKEAIRKLNNMQKEKMSMFELEFHNALMKIPKNVLNTPVDMNNEKFRSFILGIKEDSEEKSLKKNKPSIVSTTGRRRRSRSAGNAKYSVRTSQRFQRMRSTSCDAFKTPKGKIRLSTIMSHKKYTVTKPRKAQNSGLQVKRIMKPNEEAISTCGSPLYVASGNLYAPHVNIPLPGGVVLNIEPKSPKGTLEIPDLDPKTKSQIKLLCEQLNKLV